MKRIYKILSFVLVAVFMMSMISVSALAVTPGGNGSVTFTFDDITSVTADFATSDKVTITSVTFSGSLQGDCTSSRIVLYGSTKNPTDVTVTVRYTLANDAAIGSDQYITLSGRTYDGTDNVGDAFEIKKEIKVTEPSDPNPPTPPTPSDPILANTTALREQIKIARALVETDYSVESWKELKSALDEANLRLDSTSQSAVDKATERLKAAIEALVAVDRTALVDAIAKADAVINGSEDAKAWAALSEALINGNALLEGRSQKEIDAAVAAILDAIKAIEALPEKEPETIIEKVEVPVEVPVEVLVEVPGEKEMPVVALVLLIVSAVLNVALIALVVLYLVKKKSNSKDNTPLVNYNIEDDDN